jgi:plastocyanin
MSRLRYAVPAAAVFALLLTMPTFARTGARAGSQTFTVNVDGRNPKANESFLGYFPHTVLAHPGDTVVFHYVGVGEPHTVTLGTLVDAAVSTFAKLTPAQQQGQPPASAIAVDAQLPQLFPQGPGDAVASAANKCFQQSGTPGTGLCPLSQHSQPDFNGTQSYYNSGWLDANQRFSVRLSGSTAAGTYRFMCLLHREFMSGQINVVPSSTSVPSPAAQAANGAKQLAKQEAALVRTVAAERLGQAPVPHVTLPPSSVFAGGGAPNTNGSLDEFGPKTMHIKVGGTVTWLFLGDHTITFNSDKSDNDIRVNAPDGTAHLNAKALAPAGGPGEPPPGPPPSHVKGIHFKTVASSSWNGQGFHNSGIFINSFGPPVIEAYKLKFTRAGTYHYICTVHDHMKGTVVVS